MPFSCYTIGGNSLCIACTELLLERGHHVLGVITASAQVRQWADSHALRVFDAGSDYSVPLHASPFDYLFSIAHLAMIPPEVLQLPRRGAINFHDGLLPRYAGLNVPAWSLLNRETAHGVTWHLMTTRADAGDILKQATFAVDERESALTLNAKCFDAGIATFGEIVDLLGASAVRGQPQDLSRRHYFSRIDRPPAACFLDWRQSAATLDALVRATHFGAYRNLFGVAKLCWAGDAVVVNASHVVDDDYVGTPGTIVSLADDQLYVATARGVLAVDGLAELDGSAISISDVIARYALRVGNRFDTLNESQVQQLTELNRHLAKSEPFWTRRFAQLNPVMPIPPRGETASDRGTDMLTTAIPPSFVDQFKDGTAEAISAAFAAFVAITTSAQSVDLSFEAEGHEIGCANTDRWISRRVPLRVRIPTNGGFENALQAWTAERARTSPRGGWLRDLIARLPELRGRPELRGGSLDITGIHIVDTLSNRPVPSDWSSLVLVVSRQDNEIAMTYGREQYSTQSVASLLPRFRAFLERIAAAPQVPLDELSVLTAEEEQQLLWDWNRTDHPYPRHACIHHQFEQQVQRTPMDTAITFAGTSLTYDQLNRRANQLAAHLRGMGVGPNSLIGVCVERSLEMVITMLGIHKAGAAYVPLDPAFPPGRIALMLQDSRVHVVVTQAHLAAAFQEFAVALIHIDDDWNTIVSHPDHNPVTDVTAHDLAYVIYTSGSTGLPKGVMVEHRNVVNFFAGMDQRVAMGPQGENVLLAVTSLSFDISVLELLWTLTRGFKVVVYSDRHRPSRRVQFRANTSPMRFGLFFFSSDEGEREEDKYRLLIESARFADANDFVSVSTPERHFHSFGGLYPNPAVTGAALAAITQNVQIRAGSVVLPLHHPIRIAEDWSVVDNLSRGRVGISFASGWQPVDFVLRPEAYHERHRIFYEGLETIRRLWRGESVDFPDANGEAKAIRVLPRPVQKELPIWLTTAGSTETWISAGRIGAHVLTHLLGQSIDEVADKIRVYREAYRAGGHPGAGSVVMMLHTFVGDNMDRVRETVHSPMIEYLASSLSLVKNAATAWTAFKRRADGTTVDLPQDLSRLSADDMKDLLDFSFERYFATSSLFGTPEHCVAMVRRLSEIGVDEVACLIDFGIDTQTVLDHLRDLNQLRLLCEQLADAESPDATLSIADETIAALIRKHRVTHLQCTPSMASLCVADDDTRASLRHLRTLMIGGEAFPVGLARELRSATDATILNMYGPTETTIWSSTQEVAGDEPSIPIGRPIANTQFYILNDSLRPVPMGSVGELYIGGESVARGYYNQPELTADRFIRNPYFRRARKWAEPASEVIYRTGDLARYRDDGKVEFLGRTDQQVKLRGYRIELEEIEAAMMDHPEIRVAVVVVREDVLGDPRLMGYYLGNPRQPLDETSLRSLLAARLPSYMIPSRFVALAQFPQTPNRKVDRKALPIPEQQSPASDGDTSAPPANDVEAKITQIWREVLDLARIGRNDNFFDIGGHSLLALRAHRQLRNAFGKDISITDLFRFPTVSSLAVFLAADSPNSTLAQSQQRGAARRQAMTRRRHRPPGDTEA